MKASSSCIAQGWEHLHQYLQKYGASAQQNDRLSAMCGMAQHCNMVAIHCVQHRGLDASSCREIAG